jgi:hypothetical protein
MSAWKNDGSQKHDDETVKDISSNQPNKIDKRHNDGRGGLKEVEFDHYQLKSVEKIESLKLEIS